ncbi:MAG: ribonuclease Y [Candidatus Wildermuthbacteria bacterium RIFCSPHIGHO2_02_FULL_49_9]|uniref:Ribonuclease Y n=1 Tax=Candidatus Wildermuthbacteria bacterium RIFCSPHIGHO2_02_FULL_49_9 TaxID=1802456 RepID=A0A1G2RBI5_9BACT|nr:MAG: ribonuclease Y [Candidatus Wildermuthbacteria bacterium RIFCSPHIGHO2_02_FULL_49_9]
MTTPILAAVFAVGAAGVFLGYLLRQFLAKLRAGTVEQRLQKKVAAAEKEAEQLLSKANAQEDERRKALLETEQLLLKREVALGDKFALYEEKEQEFFAKVEKLKKEEQKLNDTKAQALQKLEQVAKLSREEAKKQLLIGVEEGYEKDILGRIRKLETEGQERFENRAREILSYAIQKTAVSQAQEISTTIVPLPSEDMKGKIIGKEGRNIRALERAAGVEIIVDETPEAVVISGFDPLRRHVAKVALERLIKDGRIHPARVEEEIEKVEREIEQQIKEAGEAAVFDVGIVGSNPKLVQLLGRLKFRTSYGQNVLLHSIEVAHLAGALAAEVGANVATAKKAGLFHDIGKALDHQVEGSHVDIGMRVLEKFGVEKDVISAVKSHHEQYPYETIEAVLVQTADAISAARPGARKDTLENYLKRIAELENVTNSFEGVEKSYAIQAGREIRVFVKPHEVSDLEAEKLAKDIANRIEEDLKYPGEIKVTLVRENRFVEYAR